MTTPDQPAATAGSLDALGRELATAVAPLEVLLSGPEEIRSLLLRLGWDLPPGLDAIAIAVDVGGLIDQLRAIDAASPQERDDAVAMAARYAELLVRIAKVVADIRTAAEAFSGALPAVYLQQTRIVERLPLRLLDYLIIRYTEQEHYRVYTALALLGLFQVEDLDADPGAFQVAHRRHTVRYDRLALLVTDPAALLSDVYGWAGAGFDAAALIAGLARFLQSFGAGVRPGPLSRRMEELLLGRPVPEADADPMPRLAIDLLRDLGPDGLAAGLSLVGLRPTAAGAGDGGIGLTPFLTGGVTFVVPLTATTQLDVGGAIDVEGGLALLVRPGGQIALRNLGDVAVGGAELSVGMRRTPAPGSDRIVLLQALGLGVDAAEVFVGLRAGPAGFAIEAGLTGGTVFARPTGDGFLSKVLPPDGLTASFDLVVSYDSERGLAIRGGAGLETVIPVGAVLGPLLIESVYVGLRLGETGLRLVVATSPALSLGPFAAAVDRVGVRFDVGFPAGGGNLGPAQVDVAFSPPTGVGLAIDTPAVAGGGFLELNYDAGRYSGVFELTIVDVVSVKVIAIITTKMPDGSPGFALLLIITAEGFTPVQLGMGFALTGVGGLLALNRTIDADAVRNGLRDGVLDSVLFVKDPVRNASRVLSTLDRVFPIAADRLLIGPLAEIGWGSPPIVKIRLALLLEIPQPVRVVLLAAIGVLLPDEDNPVVELHIDAIGVLDLARGELALDASLHDSRLWKFALSGDLALRLNWGDEPQFLMSVGGFHPRYAAPAGLRPLDRLTFTLTDGENPRVRFETYLALTSNTIQLGARVSVFAEAGGFGVDGGGAFDALVRWSPFGLEVGFEAWVRIFGPTGTLLAARLALTVTGPLPWHVAGVVEITFLWFTVRAGVDFTIGAATDPTALEQVDVAEMLWTEIRDPGNWQAALGPGLRPGVTLQVDGATSGAAGAALVVHPLATIGVRQKVVPLGVPVSRIGALLPRDGERTYHLDVEAPSGIQTGAVTEQFAPAQFADLTEDEKLTGPAFESLPAGVSFSAATAVAAPVARAVSTVVTVESRELTTVGGPVTPAAAGPAPADLLGAGGRPAPARAIWSVVPR